MEGIDVDRVTSWFVDRVAGIVPPLSFELIAGGRSNLTYRVTDQAGQAWALRRPPVSHVLPTAHDMGREYRIISALRDTPVPVAPTVGFCEDESVNERPFYVMNFVEGHILRDPTAAALLGEAERRTAGEHLVDVLAAIHAVDVDAVGLGQLGRREGYIERQLKRWYGQFVASNELVGRPASVVHDVHDLLASRVPPQGPATIVHGDYRLDNTLLGDDGKVKAVLDWEICTLGDPLADVGYLMIYWSDPDESAGALGLATTALPGFPRKAELIDRYAVASGRDVSDLRYYIAFGYWKLACIMEGVFSRYQAGAGGGDHTGVEGFSQQVLSLGQAALAAASGL